jgi:hypothetical protein
MTSHISHVPLSSHSGVSGCPEDELLGMTSNGVEVTDDVETERVGERKNDEGGEGLG